MSVSLESSQGISEFIQLHPDWSLSDKALTATFKFNSYSNCVVFAAAVAQLADFLDHHPNLTISYGHVYISTYTHTLNGVTQLDFKLIEEIDKLAAFRRT